MGRAVRIRIAFGAAIADPPASWVWTDVTEYWHVPDEVTISWASSSSASKVETATLGLSLKNNDSRFTPFSGRSPYWPHVIEWTPIEYAIDLGDGAGWRVRFSGYVRNWSVAWPGRSGRMAVARIQAVGELGRLERGRPPQRSAMRRSTMASAPAAYWPAEDGAESTQAASAISGHPPLTGVGVAFAELSLGSVGSLPLPDLSGGGRLTAAVPAAVTAACAAAGQYAVGFMAEVPAGAHTGDLVLLELSTPGGSFVRWRLVFFMSGSVLNWALRAYDDAGVETAVNAGAGQSFGAWRITLAQTGGNITVKLYFASNFAATATVAGTLAGPTQIVGNATGTTATSPVPFGHLTVWPTATPSLQQRGDVVDPYGVTLRGPDVRPWEREAAHLRLERLAAEEGIRITVPAVTEDGITRMGPQPAGTWPELATQCAESDQGLLYEDGFGFTYVPRVDRYNPPVVLTIDAAAGQLGGDLEPATEDPNRRNLWTVNRDGGSSATARNEDLITRQGEIEGTTTVHHLDDSMLADHAGLWLRRNSVQDARYPALSIDLYAHPELAADWCAVRPGSRVRAVNPPPQAPTGVVDQVVVGISETYHGRRGWKATINGVPAAPWTVATVDGPQRLGADGSTLGADITATSGTILITFTAANGPWTTDPAHFPFDARVGDEQVLLSAITGSSSPQTATVAPGGRGVNGVSRGWPAGTPVDVWDPPFLGL